MIPELYRWGSGQAEGFGTSRKLAYSGISPVCGGAEVCARCLSAAR